MIPQQYLAPYVVSNLIALALLALAFRRPKWVRATSVAIFLWACYTNTRIGLFHPSDYQTFAELTPSTTYRDFIHGWFREHTAVLLVPIAAGQLVIALLIMGRRMVRLLGVIGANVFLLAIAPLGVGAAFPFSIVYGLALLIMHRNLAVSTTVPVRVPIERSTTEANASRRDANGGPICETRNSSPVRDQRVVRAD